MNNFEKDLIKFAFEAKEWRDLYEKTEQDAQQITMSLMDMMVAYDVLEEHIEKLKTNPDHELSEKNWAILKKYRQEARDAYLLRCKVPSKKPLLTRWYVKSEGAEGSWYVAGDVGQMNSWTKEFSKATSYHTQKEAYAVLDGLLTSLGRGRYIVVSIPYATATDAKIAGC